MCEVLCTSKLVVRDQPSKPDPQPLFVRLLALIGKDARGNEVYTMRKTVIAGGPHSALRERTTDLTKIDKKIAIGRRFIYVCSVEA